MATPGVYNFRFSAGKEFKGKFERLAEVLGIESAARRMPEIFEKALDLALEKKDPKKKLERRKKREAARPKSRPDEASPPKTRLDEAEARGACGISRLPGVTGSAGVPPASFSVQSKLSARAPIRTCGLPV